MIDEFCIFNKGGAVLWSRQLNPPKGNPIDSLIQHVLMEEVRLRNNAPFCAISQFLALSFPISSQFNYHL